MLDGILCVVFLPHGLVVASKYLIELYYYFFIRECTDYAERLRIKGISRITRQIML